MARALVESTNFSFGGNVAKRRDIVKVEAVNCRYFRMEVRTPDGARRFYSLKADTKGTARLEAVEIVREMVQSFDDERIMWRMVGDKNWTFGTNSHEARVASKSLYDKIAYYFFGLD